jgi:hypothetical protein
MDRKTVLLVIIGLAGVLTGVVLSGALQDDDSNNYCNSVEQQIKSNQSFNGSVACYPPGVIEANVSDDIQNRTDLRCVCRIIDDSGISLYPIVTSQ